MLFGRYDYTLLVCLAILRVRTRHLQLGIAASPGLLCFPADLLIPLDTQQQPPTGQARGIHVCTWILLYGTRMERSSMEICAMILHCMLWHLSCPDVVALLRPMMQPAGIECWITAATGYYYCYLQSWMRRTAPLSGLKRLWMICCHTTFSAAVIGEISEARDKPNAAHLEHTTWRPSSCYWSLGYGDGARAQARILSIFFSIPRLCSCRLWCVPLGEDLGCCRGAFSPSSRPEIGQALGVLHRGYHSQRGCSMITW